MKTTATAKTPEQAKADLPWGSFVQAFYGRRVSSPGRPDVFKFGAVSIPLPKGIEGSALLKDLSRGQKASFSNPQGTLLAQFDASSVPADDRALGIFPALYAAAGREVERSLDAHSADFIKFQRLRATLDMGTVTLLADVSQIFTMAEPRGTNPGDDLFGGAWRQEWIFDGTCILAPDLKGKMMEIAASLAAATGYGHAEMLALLDKLVKEWYASGVTSITGHIFDETFDIGACGCSLEAELFYERSMEKMQERMQDSLIGAKHATEVREDAEKRHWVAFDEKERAAEAVRNADRRADASAQVCPSCGQSVRGTHACGKASKAQN